MERTRDRSHAALLGALGTAVRSRRQARGLTLRALAEAADVSERFLAQLEAGDGNISVARLHDVARALDTSASALLAEGERAEPRGEGPGVIALLGLRGAGKSAVGQRLARRLSVPFVELDARVEAAAGMTLATLFELHGGPYYRRIERETLQRVLAEHAHAVVAVGGGLVTDDETYGLLRSRTSTVWLRAAAEDHWNRVVAQGDARPMANRANAMTELRALLDARAPLYAQARVTIDTSGRGIGDTVGAVTEALRLGGWPARQS